jgi:flagellar FliL protein
LLMLSNRQPESFMSTEDKSKLAEEIRTELNRPLTDTLPAQGIASVSFNTFVVQ